MFKSLMNAPHREGDEVMGRIIDMRDLDERDAELLERLAKRLRKRATARRSTGERTSMDAFSRSAGSWKGLIDPERLIGDIYANRLVATRPEIKL